MALVRDGIDRFYQLFLKTFTALHYPYVLAFEPTFVEVRHVETGGLSQIIQGNNLRCLFADTPPSTTHGVNNAYNNAAYQQGYGTPNQYGSPTYNEYGRPVMQNGYASPYQNAYQRGPSSGRDEIIMVSDDRVMRLQMSPRAVQY